MMALDGDEMCQNLVSLAVSAVSLLIPASSSLVPASAAALVIATAAVSSTAISAATATVSSSATATATRATTVGKVDLDPTTIEVLFVESSDGSIGHRVGAEGDETEPARAAGVTIAHHD